MTPHRHRRLFSFALLPAACLLLAANITPTRAADAPAPQPQPAPATYTTTTIGDAVFIHPPDERPFADEIAASYNFPIRLLDQKSFDAQIDRWKKHDLPLMAKRLGLPHPTDAMNAAFDQFRDFCKPTIEEGIGEVRIYDLADLRDAAAGNTKIENITYLPDTKAVSVALYIGAEHATAAGEKKKFRVVPVILPDPKPDDLATRMRIFNGALRDMRWRLDEAIYNAYTARIYEITKPEIVATVNQSRFPLWLLEGMTNAIPLVIIRSHNPAQTFEQLLATRSAQLPPDFKKLAADIDLDTWAMTRRQQPPKPELDTYYYLALLVALDAIQQNGEDWLPEFFTRLREENSPALSMPVVSKIYTDVTGGKDLHDSIARVKDNLAKQDSKP